MTNFTFFCVVCSLFIIAVSGDSECTGLSGTTTPVGQDKILWALFDGVRDDFDETGVLAMETLKEYVENTKQTGTVDFLNVTATTDFTVLDLSIYNIIFTYDLSRNDDNFPVFYAAMGTWFKSQHREVICDGRTISSLWNPYTINRPEKQLLYNFYENLRIRGGGAYIGTDDDSFIKGTNTMMAEMGLGPFFGNYHNTTVIPVDIEHPLISYPELATHKVGGVQVIWDDSTPSSSPFNLQPDGVTILYAVAYHSGNISTPAISTSIRGSLGFLVSLTGVNCDQVLTEGDSVTLTAVLSGGTGPYTYVWSDSLDGALSANSDTAPASRVPGTHVLTLTVTDDTTGMTGQAKVRYLVQSNPSPSASPSAPPCSAAPTCCGGGGVQINFVFADMLRT
eukprot:TRINITY_DN592_c0_g2_i2.p1 TRINITY_DN592_c0_g2~~TRINITY_DN592_c0_g2_i2.p1  ORF type:complete len:394 (-),score=49.16 TRINITY_DN592_c0_g2_i2:52-1233(-)